jgi:excisionase family DNA binding protein
LLGFDDAARYLGVEPRMMRRLQTERKVAFVKVGRYVRFAQTDLYAYVERQRVQATR